MDINIKGVSFDRGIDRIIAADEQPRGELPSDGRLAPGEARAQPRLDQILHASTLADALRDELAPRLDDRGILMPDRFNRELSSALASLEAAQKAQPEHAAAFREARAVLREEQELRDLIDMYRNALFKG